MMPVNASRDLAALARRCWVTRPEKRPSFDEVVASLRPLQSGGMAVEVREKE